MPLRPLDIEPVEARMLAGTRTRLEVRLVPQTILGSVCFLAVPGDWVTIENPRLVFSEEPVSRFLTVTPSLSGPSTIMLEGRCLDRWGLIQTRFETSPLRLNVIPRARYANWLARRYLTESKSGTLPLISTVGIVKPAFGLRRGIEYYGSQLYQPGDSLRTIDWKHSIKYDRLISKEFLDSHGQEAVLLVNLAVGGPNEGDRVVFKAITAAISLAREQIPTALAAYDDQDVRLITRVLSNAELVSCSLEMVKQVVTVPNPRRYLDPPDVTRLRANISRLRNARSEGPRVLAELLEIEYASVKKLATHNPATLALNRALEKVGKQCCVVTVSGLNHDAEAIAFQTHASIVRETR